MYTMLIGVQVAKLYRGLTGTDEDASDADDTDTGLKQKPPPTNCSQTRDKETSRTAASRVVGVKRA